MQMSFWYANEVQPVGNVNLTGHSPRRSTFSFSRFSGELTKIVSSLKNLPRDVTATGGRRQRGTTPIRTVAVGGRG